MGVLESFSLRGRHALVTGGAGLFGRQIVRALAEAGATVHMASRNVDALDEYANELLNEQLEVQTHPLNQSKPESVASLYEELQRASVHVDILVNNAVARSMKAWSDPLENFESSMQINLTGVFNMTRTFGDAMTQNTANTSSPNVGKGSIINIGSIQALVGPDFTLYEGLGWEIPPDYFVHKGGLLQLTRFAAAKLGPSGVRVNMISPGGFNPALSRTFVDRYNDRTFLCRMANETDLMGAVVYLASNASAYVTGANLAIDGGYTAK